MKESSFNQNPFTIKTSDFAAGLYIIAISNQSSSFTGKFIVK